LAQYPSLTLVTVARRSFFWPRRLRRRTRGAGGPCLPCRSDSSWRFSTWSSWTSPCRPSRRRSGRLCEPPCPSGAILSQRYAAW